MHADELTRAAQHYAGIILRESGHHCREAGTRTCAITSSIQFHGGSASSGASSSGLMLKCMIRVMYDVNVAVPDAARSPQAYSWRAPCGRWSLVWRGRLPRRSLTSRRADGGWKVAEVLYVAQRILVMRSGSDLLITEHQERSTPNRVRLCHQYGGRRHIERHFQRISSNFCLGFG